MSRLREEYRQVTDALEQAYLADKAAYDNLPRRSKEFWALQPPQSWPAVPEFKDWFTARLALLQAEQRMFGLLRARCEMLRNRLDPTATGMPAPAVHGAPYMERLVDTVPDELRPIDCARLPRPGEKTTIAAAATTQAAAQTH